MSFHVILEQACDVLGFSYVEPNLERTRDGKFHAHLSFCPPHQFNSPLFEIYGSPCGRSCESKEIALIHALAYISEVLDFKIGDFNYGPVWHGSRAELQKLQQNFLAKHYNSKTPWS
jgi:hypothetical protein